MPTNLLNLMKCLALRVGQARVLHRRADVDAGPDAVERPVRAIGAVGDQAAGVVRRHGGDPIRIHRGGDEREPPTPAIADDPDLPGSQPLEVLS